MSERSDRLRVLIVDDEPIAREGVRVQLIRRPDVEIVAECGSGPEAVAAIRDLRPNVVFLDVQMPGMSGFDVLETIEPANMPAVVFVTAYDKYALKAFDVSAVDYLLKPFDAERFERAFRRAITSLKEQRVEVINRRLQTLLENLHPHKKYLDRLVIKSAGRISFIQSSEIDWAEAADNYVCLHIGDETHLIRETLSGLEAKLDPAEFVRIRHSQMVNVRRIKELHPLFKGEYEIVLQNGSKLTSSRRYRQRLGVLLGE